MADLERLLKEQEIEDQKVKLLWRNVCSLLLILTGLYIWMDAILIVYYLSYTNLYWILNTVYIIKMDLAAAHSFTVIARTRIRLEMGGH